MPAVARQLVDVVGLEQAADVHLDDGALIPQEKPLASLGVRTGATLSALVLGDPPTSPLPPSGQRRRLGRRRRRAAVGLPGAFFTAGEVLAGRTSATGDSLSATALRSAGAAWLPGAPCQGAIWRGVGRSWVRTWIVSGRGGTPWHPEAMSFAGPPGYGPTLSGLAFVARRAPVRELAAALSAGWAGR